MFLARQGKTKSEIKKFIEDTFDYNFENKVVYFGATAASLFDIKTGKEFNNTENLGKRIFEIDEEYFTKSFVRLNCRQISLF